MVILGGPRQVGKTTLSLQVLGQANEDHPAYLNWDYPENRKDLIAGILPANQGLIILDEIHKYSEWRNLIKGLYDKNKVHNKFLITGSARLDFYRRGGDSLLGRYYFYRLHPLSLFEISKSQAPKVWGVSRDVSRSR
jgi:predicted AAA+ superfamily ATPase